MRNTEEGKSIQLKELKGKTLVIVMIYTTCKAACPRLVADMRNIEKQIPELNKLAAHFKENPNVEFYALTGDLKSNLAKFLQKRKLRNQQTR